MPSPESKPHNHLLDERYIVPQHVVHREVAAHTVVLDLNTGDYFGLNPVAKRIFEVLEQTGDPRAAVDLVSKEWAVEPERVEEDAVFLCADLLARALIERV
jgi:hypothetical protein